MWSVGICGDGAAILNDGVMTPIEDVVRMLNERDQYLEALDDLKMQGTLIMENWVSVPICEWEQAFKSIGWDA